MVEVTGIIVAGGRSSRMGQDKAMLQLGGSYSTGENICCARASSATSYRRGPRYAAV